MSGITILYILLLSIPFVFVEEVEEPDEAQMLAETEFINRVYKEGEEKYINMDRIDKWWEGFKERRSVLVHKIPICMGKDGGKYPPSLEKMEDIFHDIENNGVEREDAEIELKEKKLFTLRFNTKDPFDGKKPYTIYQWVTYYIEFSKPVKAVYVQSLTGPLGVPGGEFTKALWECRVSKEELKTQTQSLIPCSFSPKTAYMFPNVFYAKGEDHPFTKTEFGFRWIQGQCQEICFLQFIIISTDDFSRYSYRKVVFRLTKLWSPSGVYYPYHRKAIAGKVDCIETHETMMLIGDDMYRDPKIIINQDYDSCLTTGFGRKRSDIDIARLQCPPGNLRCTEPWTTAAEWESKCNRAWDKFRDALKVITPTIRPPTIISTTLGPLQITQEELARNGIRQEKKEAVSHGDICILIFLIISPVSDFIVRYYKDFPTIKCLGLGAWIIVHIIFTVTGIFSFWLSLGYVAGTGNNKMGNVSGEHFAIGTVTAFLLHHQYYTGLRLGNPRRSERKRFGHLIIHVITGYVVHLCGMICVMRSRSNVGFQRTLISLFLFLICLVCHVIAVCIEKAQERSLQMHRGHCPVLQPIVSRQRKCPPMIIPKLVNLTFLIGSLTCAYVYMKIHYSVDTVILTITKDDEKGYQ